MTRALSPARSPLSLRLILTSVTLVERLTSMARVGSDGALVAGRKVANGTPGGFACPPGVSCRGRVLGLSPRRKTVVEVVDATIYRAV